MRLIERRMFSDLLSSLQNNLKVFRKFWSKLYGRVFKAEKKSSSSKHVFYTFSTVYLGEKRKFFFQLKKKKNLSLLHINFKKFMKNIFIKRAQNFPTKIMSCTKTFESSKNMFFVFFLFFCENISNNMWMINLIGF